MSYKDEFIFSMKEMPLTSFHTFETMRQKGDLCDVMFHIQNTKISAHRLVLAANIPYFGKVFLNQCTDDKTSDISFETVESIEPDAFESLINFAYTCEITVNANNARSLLVGATILQMDQIQNACLEFISARLCPSNVLDTRTFARTHSFVKLEEVTKMYMLKCFVDISHSEEFLDMSFLDLKDLISSDELHVTSEEEVFRAVIAWAKRSSVDRGDKLAELLTEVRMPLLGYHYLFASVEKEKLIYQSGSCLSLLNEAKEYCALPEKRSFPCSFKVQPRKFTNHMNSGAGIFLYAICHFKKGGLYPTGVIRYDFTTEKWQMMNAKTVYVAKAAIAVMHNKLYVIGGCNSLGKELNVVQVFDPSSDSWGKVASLQFRRYHAAAAVYKNQIYVCGGLQKSYILNYVERYVSEEDKWERLPVMNSYRRGACAVAANECIFVLGGYIYKSGKVVVSNDVEVYDIQQSEWKTVSGMPTALCNFGATVITERIYVYGGKYIEYYDPWLGEWDRISCKTEDESSFLENEISISLLAFKGKLFAVGGKYEKFDVYDIEADEWTQIESFPSVPCFIGAGLITAGSVP